jgi:tellurite resistance protein TehA-like permease
VTRWRAPLDRLQVDPGAGAVVMATGIVSIALSLDGEATLADVWLAATVLSWVVLVGLLTGRAIGDRAWLRSTMRSPASLTAVAATAVLGSLLQGAGVPAVALALLVLAAATCAGLTPPIARGWPLPRSGTSFMVTVSLEALAGLAALEAAAGETTWLVYPALALAALGLVLYLVVCARFDPRELLRGLGDQWIAGGALAISALTAAVISRAASRNPPLHALVRPLGDVAAAIWIVSAVWLAMLAVSELVALRLSYRLRRWSTLFPVGMYAASGFEVARTSPLHFSGSFAQGWVWVAVALWLVMSAGLARHAARSDAGS